MPVSHPCHLSIGLHMALQKEFQALPRIKPHIEVSGGVGQNHDKPIGHGPEETLFHPVDLCLLPREKGQLMVSLSLLLTVLLCPDRDGVVTALKFITPEPIVDLRGL
jgi:hypothetical protein